MTYIYHNHLGIKIPVSNVHATNCGSGGILLLLNNDGKVITYNLVLLYTFFLWFTNRT